MKARRTLYLISDLYGFESVSYIDYYINNLSSHFDIKFIDSKLLANIDSTIINEEEIHARFINGGLMSAVDKLSLIDMERADVLAFSIGGTIAWRHALKGIGINRLFCISSTRLRYENEKPKIDLELIYGTNDNYIPNSDWFTKMKLKPILCPNEGHDFYMKKKEAEKICDRLLRQL